MKNWIVNSGPAWWQSELKSTSILERQIVVHSISISLWKNPTFSRWSSKSVVEDKICAKLHRILSFHVIQATATCAYVFPILRVDVLSLDKDNQVLNSSTQRDHGFIALKEVLAHRRPNSESGLAYPWRPHANWKPVGRRSESFLLSRSQKFGRFTKNI